MIFLIKLAERTLGKYYRKILDLACGTGRHHKYLREEGFEVYGVDLNKELIELAKKRNKDFEEYYEVKDVRSIEYIENFDVVINWYTSFGYFSDEENRLVLRRIFRALKPKGILILDFPTVWREGVQAVEHNNYVEINKSTKIDRYTFDFYSKLFEKRGNILELVGELRIKLTVYPPEVLKNMLESVGFKVLYVFANRGIHLVRNFELTSIIRREIRRLVWVVYKAKSFS